MRKMLVLVYTVLLTCLYLSFPCCHCCGCLQTEGTSVHWYGKEPQLKRKLGHITITAPDNATARQRLKTIDPAAAYAMEAASSRDVGTSGDYACPATL